MNQGLLDAPVIKKPASEYLAGFNFFLICHDVHHRDCLLPLRWRGWNGSGNLVLNRFEAFEIGEDRLEISILNFGEFLSGHGRQNVTSRSHELAGAQYPDEQLIVPGPCTCFRIR